MKCPSCGTEMKATKRDYQYRDAGLHNVILKDLTVYECKNCREVLPEIPNIKRLHQNIAEFLIKKPSTLSGNEFRFLRKLMQMTSKELAQMLGVTTVTLSRWENNKEKVGSQSDRLLRCFYLAKVSPRKGYVFEEFQDIVQAIVTRKVKASRIFIPSLRIRKKASIKETHPSLK